MNKNILLNVLSLHNFDMITKDYNYINNYNKEQYDRFSLMLPKGKKAELQQVAARLGLSVNGLINSAIDEYLKISEKCVAEVVQK